MNNYSQNFYSHLTMNLIYFFPNKETYQFETISTEGDGMYWANINGGLLVSNEDVVDILNGMITIEDVLTAHYNKVHGRI
jgi:hypothetical protein